ncbi:hypothetical protein [Olleya namhaensis]|uniref:hypothetical protein n=1 Tax=Olleya namhaensis TaxID=1144750 RepID=UPI00248F9847|nr:hypothetical protein [Olleya namhaensis]
MEINIGDYFFNILNEFKVIENYNINENNCTNQGIDCLNAGGINLPDTQGSWFLGYGGGNNPADLGEDIREMELEPNMTRFTNPGNAPENTGGGC